MARNKKTNIVFYDRYLLTVEEAAVYFHIGSKKMRNMIKDHEGAKWILYKHIQLTYFTEKLSQSRKGG